MCSLLSEWLLEKAARLPLTVSTGEQTTLLLNLLVEKKPVCLDKPSVSGICVVHRL
jgi:hypothetical protein